MKGIHHKVTRSILHSKYILAMMKLSCLGTSVLHTHTRPAAHTNLQITLRTQGLGAAIRAVHPLVVHEANGAFFGVVLLFFTRPQPTADPSPGSRSTTAQPRGGSCRCCLEPSCTAPTPMYRCVYSRITRGNFAVHYPSSNHSLLPWAGFIQA